MTDFEVVANFGGPGVDPYDRRKHYNDKDEAIRAAKKLEAEPLCIDVFVFDENEGARIYQKGWNNVRHC